MIYDLEHYDEAYEFVTTHEGYEIVDLGNKTYEVRPIPPKPEPTKEEIQEERSVRYKNETDALMIEYLRKKQFNELTVTEEQELLKKIKDGVNKIKEDLPYPVK